MAITSVVELPREFEQEISKPAIARRRWVCNLDDETVFGKSPGGATSESIILQATASSDLKWGHPHPTFTYLRFRKVQLQEAYEGDPYKALVTGEYSIIRDEEVIEPRLRDAVWSSESGSIELPALYYYSGSGNALTYPLTNSAYDFYQGLTTLESLIRFRVVKNYGPTVGDNATPINSLFPSTQANAINHLNNALYGNATAHTFKCTSVNISLNYEEFGGQIAKYWQVVSELQYRQTGWNLRLPDVGFNFIESGQKRRAMVFDFQNGEWVASPNPVGLNGNGAQTGGAPAILNRRVLPEANFTSIFGAFPA
jgi:hypothetical protein